MGAATSHPDSAFPTEEAPSHWLYRRHGRVSACAEDEDAVAVQPVRRIRRVRSLSLEPEPRTWTEQEPESPIPASEGSPSDDPLRHRRGGSWGGKLTPRLDLRLPSLPFRPRKKATASSTGSPGQVDSNFPPVRSLRAVASLPKDFKVEQDWLCVAPPQTLSPQTPPGTTLQERVMSRLRRTSPLSLSSLPEPEESSTSSLPGLVLPSASSSSFTSTSGFSTSSTSSSPSSQSSGFTSPCDILSAGELENSSAESFANPYYVTQMYMVKEEADAGVTLTSSGGSDPAWIGGTADSEAELSEDDNCMEDELEDMSFYHQQLQLYHVRFPAGVDRSTSFKWQPKLESIIEFDVGKEVLAQVLSRRRSLGSADMREVMEAVEEVSKADRDALPSLLRMQHR